MFVCRSGTTLSAIYGADKQCKPEEVPRSNSQGVTLSDVQRQMITNSKFFEAGASMCLLAQPGKIGDVFDQHTLQLFVVLQSGLNEQNTVGDFPVHYQGSEQILRNVLQTSIIPLSEHSDQIGRQMKTGQALQPWLLETLSTPLKSGASGASKECYTNLLTKIRTSGAFGNMIWQLMNPVEDCNQPQLYAQHKDVNTVACVALLHEAGFKTQAKDFARRFNEFSGKTRPLSFDSPLSRARSERVNGVVPSREFAAAVAPPDAAQQFLPEGSNTREHNDKTVPNEYTLISGLTRPFTMSDMDMEIIPEAYVNMGITKMLERFAMRHGANHWEPFGTFAVESNLQGLPSAGAQSGSACDILLALNTLSPKQIYGSEKALDAGLGIAAFMNFGGYHTFAETFPIAESVAANRPYVPSSLAATNQVDLYQRIEMAAQSASPMGAKQLAQFRQSHAQVLEGLSQQQPDLEQSLGSEVNFYGTAQQIEYWRK